MGPMCSPKPRYARTLKYASAKTQSKQNGRNHRRRHFRPGRGQAARERGRLDRPGDRKKPRYRRTRRGSAGTHHRAAWPTAWMPALLRPRRTSAGPDALLRFTDETDQPSGSRCAPIRWAARCDLPVQRPDPVPADGPLDIDAYTTSRATRYSSCAISATPGRPDPIRFGDARPNYIEPQVLIHQPDRGQHVRRSSTSRRRVAGRRHGRTAIRWPRSIGRPQIEEGDIVAIFALADDLAEVDACFRSSIDFSDGRGAARSPLFVVLMAIGAAAMLIPAAQTADAVMTTARRAPFCIWFDPDAGPDLLVAPGVIAGRRQRQREAWDKLADCCCRLYRVAGLLPCRSTGRAPRQLCPACS